jgi:hypothetical protein
VFRKEVYLSIKGEEGGEDDDASETASEALHGSRKGE